MSGVFPMPVMASEDGCLLVRVFPADGGQVPMRGLGPDSPETPWQVVFTPDGLSPGLARRHGVPQPSGHSPIELLTEPEVSSGEWFPLASPAEVARSMAGVLDALAEQLEVEASRSEERSWSVREHPEEYSYSSPEVGAAHAEGEADGLAHAAGVARQRARQLRESAGLTAGGAS